MLTRAIASFAVAVQQMTDLVEVKVLVVSDQPVNIMKAEIERLHCLFPGLELSGCPFVLPPHRYSRTEALLTAIDQVETDYIWFVDDDDFIFPGAVRNLARVLTPNTQRLVVGNSLRIEETWVDNGKDGRLIMKSRQVGRNVAEGVFHAFDGDNHTPICSIVFPVDALKKRLAGVAARGDYYEDYFLLLLTLSSPFIEIRLVFADLCGISLRAGENTVTEPCRDHWDLSYVTFVSELLCHPDGANPLLWQLAERMGRPPAPLQEILHIDTPWWCSPQLAKLCDPRERSRLLKRFHSLHHTNGLRAAFKKAWRYFFHG